MPNNIKVTAALWTTIILWASAFVGIRYGLTYYSPGGLALLRYFIASICMLILYFSLPKRNKINLRDLPLLFLLGVLGFAVYNVSLNYGEITVPAGIASFIIGLIPVITISFAILFLNEKITVKIALGLAVSLIGMLLIMLGEHGGVKFDYGVLLVLVATLMGGIYTSMQKPILKKFHPIELTAFAIWSGTIAMMIYAPDVIKTIAIAPWHVTAVIAYLGIFPAAIAYVVWAYAFSKTDASKAVMYLYAMPILSTLMGYLFLGEIPALLSIIGGLIALSGVALVHEGRKSLKP